MCACYTAWTRCIVPTPPPPPSPSADGDHVVPQQDMPVGTNEDSLCAKPDSKNSTPRTTSPVEEEGSCPMQQCTVDYGVCVQATQHGLDA